MSSILDFPMLQERKPEAQEGPVRCTECYAPVNVRATCDCNCDVFRRFKPTQLAKLLVKKHPDLNDQMLADRYGVGRETMRMARKAVSQNWETEKRKGKDGKSYPTAKQPRQPREQVPPANLERAQGIVRALQADGAKVNPVELAKQYKAEDITLSTFRLAIDAERTRIHALTEKGESPLSNSAKARLDAAIRQHKKQLDLEFNTKVAERVTAVYDENFPKLQERLNRAYEAEKNYREYLAKQKKIFTKEQYNTLRMCVHPDSGENVSKSIRTEVMIWLNERKFALTGEK